MLSTLKNLKVTWKLFLVGVAFLVCAGSTAWMAASTFGTVKVGGPLYENIAENKDLLADVLPPPEYIVESYLLANQLVSTSDRAAQDKLVERAAKLHREFEDRNAYWVRVLPDGKNKEVLTSDAYRPAQKFYELLEGSLVGAVRAGDQAKARAILAGPMSEVYEQHRLAIDQVVTFSTAESARQEADVRAMVAASGWRLLGFGLLMVTVVMLLLRLVSMQIVRPLHETMHALRRVAEGDLTTRLKEDREDELGQLIRSLNLAASSMGTMVSRVSQLAATVATASHELSGAAHEISHGAQEQAASLEETAASLEEISATAKNSATSAGHASRMASESREAADRGRTVVGAAVEAMNQITVAAKSIGDISGAIDEIAFQTNLLALNAAVEAARAGEQGRGFAVVAAEVRTLALRSATASKQIKSLIVDSIAKIEAGAIQIRQSGDRLEEIVRSAAGVTDVVNSIAGASNEQSSGIEQVTRAISQLDSVTQSNAAQTEELSATAETLSVHSNDLSGLLARFRVDERTLAEATEAEAASLVAAKAAAAEHEVADQERWRREHGGRIPSLPPPAAIPRIARRASSRSLRPEPPRTRSGARGRVDSMSPPDGRMN